MAPCPLHVLAVLCACAGAQKMPLPVTLYADFDSVFGSAADSDKYVTFQKNNDASLEQAWFIPRADAPDYELERAGHLGPALFWEQNPEVDSNVVKCISFGQLSDVCGPNPIACGDAGFTFSVWLKYLNDRTDGVIFRSGSAVASRAGLLVSRVSAANNVDLLRVTVAAASYRFTAQTNMQASSSQVTPVVRTERSVKLVEGRQSSTYKQRSAQRYIDFNGCLTTKDDDAPWAAFRMDGEPRYVSRVTIDRKYKARNVDVKDRKFWQFHLKTCKDVDVNLKVDDTTNAVVSFLHATAGPVVVIQRNDNDLKDEWTMNGFQCANTYEYYISLDHIAFTATDTTWKVSAGLVSRYGKNSNAGPVTITIAAANARPNGFDFVVTDGSLTADVKMLQSQGMLNRLQVRVTNTEPTNGDELPASDLCNVIDVPQESLDEFGVPLEVQCKRPVRGKWIILQELAPHPRDSFMHICGVRVDTYSSNRWFHLGLSVNANFLKVFIDGKKVAQSTSAVTITEGTYRPNEIATMAGSILGANIPVSQPFEMAIDELYFLSGVLNDTEMQKISRPIQVTKMCIDDDGVRSIQVRMIETFAMVERVFAVSRQLTCSTLSGKISGTGRKSDPYFLKALVDNTQGDCGVHFRSGTYELRLAAAKSKAELADDFVYRITCSEDQFLDKNSRLPVAPGTPETGTAVDTGGGGQVHDFFAFDVHMELRRAVDHVTTVSAHVGESVYLHVTSSDDAVKGIRVHSCAAVNSQTKNEVALVNSDGCANAEVPYGIEFSSRTSPTVASRSSSFRAFLLAGADSLTLQCVAEVCADPADLARCQDGNCIAARRRKRQVFQNSERQIQILIYVCKNGSSCVPAETLNPNFPGISNIPATRSDDLYYIIGGAVGLFVVLLITIFLCIRSNICRSSPSAKKLAYVRRGLAPDKGRIVRRHGRSESSPSENTYSASGFSQSRCSKGCRMSPSECSFGASASSVSTVYPERAPPPYMFRPSERQGGDGRRVSSDGFSDDESYSSELPYGASAANFAGARGAMNFRPTDRELGRRVPPNW